MAKQVIGIGTTANDGTGDSLRTSGSKTNDNFGEVYNLLGDGWTLPTGIVTTLTAGDNIALSGSTGNVTITGTATTANINADSLVVTGVTTLSELNATGDVNYFGQVTNNGNVVITGDVTIGGTVTSYDTETVNISRKFVRLGVTSTTEDIANDLSADAGGFGIASTEGNPLITGIGSTSAEDYYKKIVWRRENTISAGTTDSFILNYALGIGTVPLTGRRFAVGSGIEMTDTDVTATTFTGNLTGNVTGDVTGTATTATNLADAANITTGTIADARFPATLPAVSGVDLTGIVTSITAGDNISVSGATGNVTITGLANTANVVADTLVVSGVSTLSSATFSDNISGTTASFSGSVSIGGTLTYEDVTNIDSVGLITARSGIVVTGGEILVGSAFSVGQAGVITATSFIGNQAVVGSAVTINSTGVDVTGVVTATGVNVTNIITSAGANVTGVVTSSEYDGYFFLDSSLF